MYIKEHRRAGRARHDSVCELYDEKGALLGLNARLVDVSATGLGFLSTAALAKGARVRARLRMPWSAVLDVTGRVVRIRERSNVTFYGVDFDR